MKSCFYNYMYFDNARELFFTISRRARRYYAYAMISRYILSRTGILFIFESFFNTAQILNLPLLHNIYISTIYKVQIVPLRSICSTAICTMLYAKHVRS